jgi:hypothetical protein
MVVGDDDVDSFFFRVRDRIERGCADVDGDDELHAARRERINGIEMKPVALSVAMRQIDFKILISDLYEKIRENCSPWNAVAIEIRVDRDAFALFHRRQKPLDGNIHPLQQKRVVRVEVVVGIEEGRDVKFRFDPSSRKQ